MVEHLPGDYRGRSDRPGLGASGIGRRLAPFVKFCRNRRGPWGFTFHRDHQVQYQKVVDEYGDCILVLVCGRDGFAALNFIQVREVLDDQFEEQETISVRRKLKHMYSVGGTNGKLSGKVARDSLMQHVSKLIGRNVFPIINEEDDKADDGDGSSWDECAPALPSDEAPGILDFSRGPARRMLAQS